MMVETKTTHPAHNQALDAFQNLLGPKGFSTDAGDIAPWLTDWRGRYTGKAAAMLSPSNTGEVSALVKIAARHRIALVPQGGNSGMVAGATPDSSGHAVLLSLRRMNVIAGIADDGSITCQAGVILQNLHESAAARGRRFPLTLGGKGSATVGGLISTNAGGTQVLRHGTMRSLVTGLEAVLPDGSVFHGLSPLKKDNRGYDLKHLMIGAEGTLGIVTGAVLQTVPALIDRCVVWAGVDSPQSAYKLLLHLQSLAKQSLEGFEILPESALQAVINHIAGTRGPLPGRHRWHVLIELVQDDPAQAAPNDLATRILASAMEAGLLQDAIISASETQAEAFWKIRDSIAAAERAEGPALQHDISVPVADMARFIAEETPVIEAKFAGTKIVAFGHLGDGNIHFHVKAPRGSIADDWYARYSKDISEHVYDRVEAYSGSISAEHGIGQLKLAELARLADPARIGALRAIKNAIDPLGIMNPGKLVPLA
jgi:FAD/FMN-containing dehydrogenase